MKKLILLLLLIPIFCIGQNKVCNYLKTHALKGTLMYTAGMCDGHVEVLQHHYSDFKTKFPNAKDNFWNPDVSWQNKWENGDRSNGEKFPMSSTAFVWTTDAYHAFKMGQKSCIFFAMGIPVNGESGFNVKTIPNRFVFL